MTRPAGWYHCRVSGGLSLRRCATLVDRYADIGIAIAALLLFTPGLGAVHLFDRDEINFAEIAREMLVTGEWSQPSVGFRPFYEKPPLFMWLQALSMSVFGVGELSGLQYRGTGGTFEHEGTARDGFPYTYSFVNNFRIIGQGPNNNLLMHMTVHQTINANGDFTADVDLTNSDCK